MESDTAASPISREVFAGMERADGNTVNLDRESLLMAENQLRFRTGIQLLRSELQKISMAISEGRYIRKPFTPDQVKEHVMPLLEGAK
jgi:flagellar basal body rod protein FlgB